MELRMDYQDHGLRVQTMRGHCGVGTHIDAPAHFIPNGCTIDQIPITQLISSAVVLDLRKHCTPTFKVEVCHLKQYEIEYGPIPSGAIVIAFTGWSQFWSQPEKYLNIDSAGKRRFPGFSAECARYLASIPIAAIGIDTLSPDGDHDEFPVHQAILGGNRYIIENLANLDQMPPSGGWVASLPLPYVGGTEAGARTIGLIQK
jgi:kynurenine formamidase